MNLVQQGLINSACFIKCTNECRRRKTQINRGKSQVNVTIDNTIAAFSIEKEVH